MATKVACVCIYIWLTMFTGLSPWPWLNSTKNNNKCFSRHWLGNSNNTITHLTVVFFLQPQEVDCYLINFWPWKEDPYILWPSRWLMISHCLLVLSSLFTGHFPAAGHIFTADFLPLSAYMDTGWKLTPLSIDLCSRKLDHPKASWVASLTLWLSKSINKILCLTIQGLAGDRNSENSGN